MDRFDRIFELHTILRARRTPVARAALEEELRCSPATVKRLIAHMRDVLGAPIEYDRARNGYYYAGDAGHPFELPGLWFSEAELRALLASYELLRTVQPGLLEEHVAPIRQRIGDLLSSRPAGHPEVAQRVRIIQMAPRATDPVQFRLLANALLERHRVRILYHGRARDETTERTISPQRLVYYRDNWYLDAWCHLRDGLRTFAVDRAHVIETLADETLELEFRELNDYFTAAYGIFAGPADRCAVLRFSSSAARWVADEQWHPGQELSVLADGGIELRIPYSNDIELVMDVLRHGPDVVVVEPESLREAVRARLEAALDQYR